MSTVGNYSGMSSIAGQAYAPIAKQPARRNAGIAGDNSSTSAEPIFPPAGAEKNEEQKAKEEKEQVEEKMLDFTEAFEKGLIQRQQENDWLRKANNASSKCWGTHGFLRRNLELSSLMASEYRDPGIFFNALSSAFQYGVSLSRGIGTMFSGEDMPASVSGAIAALEALCRGYAHRLSHAAGRNSLDDWVRREIIKLEAQGEDETTGTRSPGKPGGSTGAYFHTGPSFAGMVRAASPAS